jgi:signal transduction histidine kinase
MEKNTIIALQQKCKEIRLLYVEDNELARISTLDVLHNFFDTVDTANDGSEGLEKFKQKNYDLIITDINMPHMNGLEMIDAIKKINNEIPILIISAYNESNYFLETIKLGVEGYLLKPIDLEQFLQMISKTVEKIELRRQNQKYKEELEQKVKAQVQELIEKDKIITQKSKLALMGEMVDAIAHQFKQPLSIIQLQALQLEDAYKSDTIDNQVIADSTSGTISQVEHLSETISQFRDFLRPQLDVEKIKIETVLSSVLLLTQDELKQHQIEVLLKGDLDLHVNIIPGEFKHVLINLLNNAKDAFVERETKTKKQITISVSSDSDNVYVEVADNAGGIPESIIHKIFKPNFSVKQNKQSSGIGLYISETIIKKIGGEISVRNDKDGAVFTVVLQKKLSSF